MRSKCLCQTSRGERGTTLVEVLVALVIGVLVLSAASTAVRTGAASLHRMQGISDIVDGLARAQSVVMAEAFRALPTQPIVAMPSLLQFTMPAREGDGFADQVLVTYRLDPGPTQSLVRLQTRVSGTTQTAWDDPVILLDGLQGAHFRFLNETGAWVETWERRTGRPRGFALFELTSETPRLAGIFPLEVPLACVQPADISCLGSAE